VRKGLAWIWSWGRWVRERWRGLYWGKVGVEGVLELLGHGTIRRVSALYLPNEDSVTHRLTEISSNGMLRFEIRHLCKLHTIRSVTGSR
jgi:hypothetical protein